MDQFPAQGLKARWRMPLAEGYAGPAVAAGRVYVTDFVPAKNGRGSPNPFDRGKIAGKERVLCLDEATGAEVWLHEYPCDYQVSYAAGPRTTPVVDGDRVYTLGTMGDLLCLETRSGKPIWSRNFIKDFNALVPLWGFAAHPLLDGDKLICLVGAPNGLAMAFDKHTGKDLWQSLSAREPGYCPPMIYELAGRRQLIIWHPESVNGLDPETGQRYWSVPFEVKAGLTIPTPRQLGDDLFLTSFYDGAMLLRFERGADKPSVVWKGKVHSEDPRRTDTLHSIMPTPVVKDGYIYGVCSYGELRCLKAATGDRVWQTRQPTGGKQERWANAFLVPQGERYFLFNEQGDLILAKMTPAGYEEISKAHLLEPTNHLAGRPVVWSHPAFANRCVFVRNDKEIICVSLAKPE
jgi:outer membrane protein assembly factor BamB